MESGNPRRKIMESGNPMDKTSPTHYQFGKVQVIDITQHLGFLEGNVVKYICRAGNKTGESKMDDLKKAEWYVKKLIEIERAK